MIYLMKGEITAVGTNLKGMVQEKSSNEDFFDGQIRKVIAPR